MNLSRRTLLGATVAIAAVGATSACSATPGGGSGGGGGGDTIKLGVNYELSGGVATYGQASVAGIKMAIDAINEAGGVNGKKIDLVQYDNKSELAEATTLANKLMAQDKVLACMGPATSGNFKATIPVANQNKIPVVSGSATADDVTWDGTTVQEYAFRICFSDSFQGTIMGKFASENLQAKTAVIIKDNSSDYSKGLAAAHGRVGEGNASGSVPIVATSSPPSVTTAVATTIPTMEPGIAGAKRCIAAMMAATSAARNSGTQALLQSAPAMDSPAAMSALVL